MLFKKYSGRKGRSQEDQFAESFGVLNEDFGSGFFASPEEVINSKRSTHYFSQCLGSCFALKFFYSGSYQFRQSQIQAAHFGFLLYFLFAQHQYFRLYVRTRKLRVKSCPQLKDAEERFVIELAITTFQKFTRDLAQGPDCNNGNQTSATCIADRGNENLKPSLACFNNSLAIEFVWRLFSQVVVRLRMTSLPIITVFHSIHARRRPQRGADGMNAHYAEPYIAPHVRSMRQQNTPRMVLGYHFC